MRLGCAHRARLGKGAAPQLAGHARRRYSRDVHAAGTRADRPLRLDRNRLRGGPLPPPAAVRRHQRRGAGRVHRGPGRARARAGGSRLGARHVRLGVHAPGQELRGARRRGRCVGRRPRLRQGAGGAGEERSRLAHVAGGLHPCARQGRNRCAAGRRGRGIGVPRTSHGAQQRAGPSGRSGARGIHRRTARAWRLLLCAPRSAALRAGARAVAHGRARTPTARPSLRVQPVAVGLRRSRPPLHRRARGRTRLRRFDRGPGAAGRGAREGLGGLEALDRPHRRSGVRRAEQARGLWRARHLQLLVPRHARVPRDVRLVADAAGLPAAAGERGPLVPGDEEGARRTEVRGACRSRRWSLRVRVVAPLDRRHWRRRGERRRCSVPERRARAPGGRATRRRDIHRVRRLRAGGGTCARPVRPRQRLLGDRIREGSRVPVPLLPQAGPGSAARGRARARPRCLARSAHARIRAARRVRGAPSQGPRREAPADAEGCRLAR